MGAEAVMAGVGAAGSIYGGYRAASESRKEAKNIMNDAEAQALQMEDENNKLMSEQESRYAKSGVILDGSPLLVIEETRSKGLADRLRLRESGRNKAHGVAAQGRAQFIGGVTNGMAKMGGAMGGMGGGGGGGFTPSSGVNTKSYSGGTSYLSTGMD